MKWFLPPKNSWPTLIRFQNYGSQIDGPKKCDLSAGIYTRNVYKIEAQVTVYRLIDFTIRSGLKVAAESHIFKSKTLVAITQQEV